MNRLFRRRTNARGEWSILDVLRGYRICKYNHDHHGGTHVHFPETGAVIDLVEIDTFEEAEQIMESYAMAFETFDLNTFQEMIRTCKYASDGE